MVEYLEWLYVNRMRGYYITKHKLEGWEDGTMKSWYFTLEERVSINGYIFETSHLTVDEIVIWQRLQMRSYIPVRKPIYRKEFAIARRDIDKGINEIPQ